MSSSKGKAFRSKAPQSLISHKKIYSVAKSQDTDSVSSDESLSILSQSISLKRKLPAADSEHETRRKEDAHQTSPSSSETEEYGQSASQKKPIAG